MTLSRITIDSTNTARADMQQKFRGLRRSFLFWKSIDSISVTAIWTFVAFAALLWVDSFVRIPWQLRLVLVAALIATVIMSLVRLLQLILVPPRYSDLARAMQSQDSDAKSNLIAASMILEDIQGEKSLPPNASTALVYAANSLRDWPWYQSIDRTKPVICLAISMLLLIGSIWANRIPGLSALKHRWFSVLSGNAKADFTLRFVDPPSYAYNGQTIEVEVKPLVPLNDRVVQLEVNGLHDAVQTVDSANNTNSRFRISNVRSSLTIQASAGHRIFSESISIPLQTSIQILAHEFDISPPAYLKNPKYKSNRVELTVTQNANVALRFDLSETANAIRLKTMLNDAEILLQGKIDDKVALFDLSELTQKTRLALGEKSSTESLRYNFVPIATDEQGSEYALNYPLAMTVQSDSPPQFEGLQIESVSNSVSGDKVDRLTGSVRDDHEVLFSAVEFQGITSGREKIDESMHDVKVIMDIDVGSPQFQIQEPLDIQRLAMLWPTCDAIDVSVVAIDNAGQRARSAPLRVSLQVENDAQRQALQGVRDILEKQLELNERTSQAVQMDRIPEQLLARLATDQQTIREAFGASISSDSKNEDPTNATLESIGKLMEASSKSIQQAQLDAAKNLQQAIVDRLKELARNQRSGASLNNPQATESSKNALQDKLANWSDRQGAIVDRLKLAKEDDSIDLQKLAEQEGALQEEIAESIVAIDAASPLYWPLNQTTNALAKAKAKLLRYRRDESVVIDAALAEDLLRSLLKTAREESSSTNAGTKSDEAGDKASDQDSDRLADILRELEIIRDLQVAIRDRFAAIPTTDSKSDLQEQQSLAVELSNQQKLIADRLRELIQMAQE